LNKYFSQFKGHFNDGNTQEIKDRINEFQAKIYYQQYLEVKKEFEKLQERL
jgi:hypothetical protein